MDEMGRRSAIEEDLGGDYGRRVPTVTADRGQDMVRMSREVTRHVGELMNQGGPETLLDRFFDKLAPSPLRTARQRGEVELVQAEIQAEVHIHAIIRNAQVQEMKAMADTYATQAELRAREQIASRGLETALRVDLEIEISGEAFDRSVDAAMKIAKGYESATARQCAGERIVRRMQLRAELEEEAMRGIREALRPRPSA